MIARAIRLVSRRMGLGIEEREELESEVWLHFVQNGERILDRFEGRSSLRSYLCTVVANLGRDYRIRKWGKWRPSAAALRLGAVAVRLEVLLHRDGFTHREALRRVMAEHARWSEAELEELLEQLPERAPRRREVELTSEPGSPSRADEQVVHADRADGLARIKAEIARAIGDMSHDERRLMRERFLRGRTVTEIAADSDVDRRVLYRTVERCLLSIRRHLDWAGIDRDQLLAVVQSTDLSITFSVLEASG
ncbi:MAG: sigma-70 family RNA polymerase sigma factor [Acidobacteria bacterium]|nr:MAG: sigma-70 family RNA polymerase sigma factor [Acidobacteriota bacterium]